MSDKIIFALDVNEIQIIIQCLNYVLNIVFLTPNQSYAIDLLKRKLQAELDKHCPVKPQ